MEGCRGGLAGLGGATSHGGDSAGGAGLVLPTREAKLLRQRPAQEARGPLPAAAGAVGGRGPPRQGAAILGTVVSCRFLCRLCGAVPCGNARLLLYIESEVKAFFGRMEQHR